MKDAVLIAPMNLTMTTTDGVTLHGTLIKSDSPKAVVMIAPGTAVQTSIYMPFAEHIASHGYHVFVWNYRGFGESKRDSLKGSRIRFTDFGRFDIPAVIDKLKAEYPDLPLYYIGHSAGGQQLGLASNRHKIDALIAIAVSGGYFPNMPMPYRLKARLFFHVIVPLCMKMLKYVPAKALHLMEDLPGEMANEWGDWCSEPDYYFSKKFYGHTVPEGTYKNVTFPVHVLTASDDEISSQPNVDAFWKHVETSNEIAFIRYNAQDSPIGRIGHFGYFWRANRTIWRDVTDILNRGGKPAA